MQDPKDPGDRATHTELGTPGRVPESVRNVLLFLPRLAILLGKLIADPEVSNTDKLLLGAAIAYMLSPFDIVPDVVPVVGQLDDAFLIALCLLRLMNRSGEAKIRQYWDGPEDIVQVLHTVSDYSTRYLPEAVRKAVRNWIDLRDTGAAPPAA